MYFVVEQRNYILRYKKINIGIGDIINWEPQSSFWSGVTHTLRILIIHTGNFLHIAPQTIPPRFYPLTHPSTTQPGEHRLHIRQLALVSMGIGTSHGRRGCERVLRYLGRGRDRDHRHLAMASGCLRASGLQNGDVSATTSTQRAIKPH